MYSIYLDNKLIWNSRATDKLILNPTIKLEVNKVGSASFKVLPNHSAYNQFEKMRSIITIEQDKRTLFKGRIYSESEDFYKTKSIEVEGLLGYLNDSIVRTYEFSGSPTEYLTMLINQHNAQVESYQQFKVGRVTITDNNDYITRGSSDNLTTWGEINSKLIDLLGGYIVIRYEDDGNYIDYLADYEDTSTQHIAFAVNLLDLNLETKADELATCIIPYGATDEETQVKLDITSVNDGIDYIYDADAVATYGKIYEVVTWDDVTIPSNLLNKARVYLTNKIKLSTKIEVKAIDLHLSDEQIESFMLGDYIKVYSKPHQIDERALLTAYNLDLSNPTSCSITLGMTRTSYIRNAVKDTTNRIDNVKKELGETISNQTNKILSESKTYTNSEIDNSEQHTREMMSQYVSTSELEEYKQEVSTQFTQTSDQFNFQFDTINERISNENGDIIDNLEEIHKYIRFVDGAIYLGEVGYALTTRIANGRISFLYNDSLEVAYISDRTLYITDAEFLNKIVIGNFAFIPRTNGNLSFTKIK